MHTKKIKVTSLVLLMAVTMNITGCQKQQVLNNVSTKNNEIKITYTKEEFQKEYLNYLQCLTYLTHEIPSDTYVILGYNYNKTKYSEFKQTQLISFDNIDKLRKLIKTSKVSEIKNLSQKLLKATENTQYQLVEVANKKEVIDTVEEIKPIIEEYTKVLTEELAKIESDTIKPLLEKNDALNVKKEFNKQTSKMFKEERERYIGKLEYLYKDKTKKVLNKIYDNL